MRVQSHVLIFLVLILLTSIQANPFSRTNRFDFSYEYHDYINREIFDTASATFFSLPAQAKLTRPQEFLTYRTQEQKLSLNANSTAGFAARNSEKATFVAVGSNVAYESQYLEASVRFNTYTLDNLADMIVSDIEYERFISGNEPPIEGVFNFDFNLPQAFTRLRFKNIEVLTGRHKLRWGPGYKGTLGLSGTTLAPFYFYHGNLHLGQRFKLSCFLKGLDDAPSFRSEFSGTEDTVVSEIVKTCIDKTVPRYNAGQRLDLRIGKYLQLGIYELCDFYGSKDLIRYANPLQIYPVGQNSGGGGANLLGGFDFNILFGAYRLYGEIINDDITIFDNCGNPNKYGYQLGSVLYGRQHITEIGAEYTHVSKYVYGNHRILSRHTFWGESQGWPWGNDQDLFHVRTICRMRPNIHAKAEINYWLKGKGDVTDDWNDDGRPDLDHAPYWPQNPDKILSFIFTVNYQHTEWTNIDLFYRPRLINGQVEHGIYTYFVADMPGKWNYLNLHSL